MANEKIGGEIPRYRLTEPAYIEDTYYDPESKDSRFHEVNYSGIPGHHMEPVNEAAKAMKLKHPHKYHDPIVAMTNVTAQSIGAAENELAASIAQAIVKSRV